MTSPYDDDPDGARLRGLLDSATGAMHAGPDLARRTIAAHRRRRRRLVAVTAVVAAVAVAGGTSLAVTLTGGHHNRSVLATDNASPRPSPTGTPLAAPDICGPRQSGEISIVPNGGSPYLRPEVSRGASSPRVTYAAARNFLLGSANGSDARALLRRGKLQLYLVREPALRPKPTSRDRCEQRLAWVLYGPTDPLSVPMGATDVNSTCVMFFIVDGQDIHRGGGESIVCTSHAAPNCPASPPTGRIGGGPLHSFGQQYKQLPTTPGTWTKLPNSPLSTRYQPVVIWAGSQLVVWGGEVDSHSSAMRDDGAAYDPAARRWTMLPSAPISGRLDAAAVWTGTELVVWGGYDDVGINRFHVAATGAAYNPQTRTWRELPKSPLQGAHGAGIAWTGSNVVIVDGQPAITTNTVRSERQVAAWDPASNHWRSLPREPAGTPSAFNVTVAHWANDRLLVFHGYGVTSDPAATTVDSYDPATNRWTHLRKCDGAGYVGAAYDLDGQVLVPPFYNAPAYLYSPQHNTWTPTATLPLSANASALTPDNRLLILTGSLEGYDIKPGDAALWDPRTDSWAKPPRMPVRTGDYPVAVGASNAVLVWTGDDAAQLYAFTP